MYCCWYKSSLELNCEIVRSFDASSKKKAMTNSYVRCPSRREVRETQRLWKSKLWPPLGRHNMHSNNQERRSNEMDEKVCEWKLVQARVTSCKIQYFKQKTTSPGLIIFNEGKAKNCTFTLHLLALKSKSSSIDDVSLKTLHVEVGRVEDHNAFFVLLVRRGAPSKHTHTY